MVLFAEFSAASLDATEKAWCDDADAGLAFRPDIEQQMSWAREHRVVTNNSVAYGVFEKGKNVAVGICELVITQPTKRGKWIKVLRLRLRPKVEDQIFRNDKQGLMTAIDAYVTCVQGVFAVKNEHKATTIKVYGRTQEQVKFLTLLSAALEKRPGEATFRSSIEGRWLVLNWAKP